MSTASARTVEALSLDRSALLARYHDVRRTTERLCAPLSAEDHVVQAMPDVSPTKWHLAHVSWFFEAFLLAPALPGYQPFHETHKRRLVYCDPDNIGPLIDASLIGNTETVRAKLQRLFDVGYSYVIVIPSIPSVPAGLRQDWLTRFARDVMPHFRKR